MSVVIATTRTACNTSTGNQDITTTDLGGLTPKAAFFTVTHATVDGTATDHAIIGIGAATATDERWSCSVGSENAQGTTDTDRRGATDECIIKLLAGSASVDGEADFVSFITNGVRINWGNAPASGFLLTVTLYAGTDLSAKAGISSLSTQDNTTDVNTVGFEPDVVFFGTHNTLINDSGYTLAMLSYGVATNKNPVVQSSWVWASNNGQASGTILAQICNNYAFGQCSLTELSYGCEVGTFDASGFSITSRLGDASADNVGYLALAFNNVVDFKTGIIDSPTSTGSQSITDPGFKPQYVNLGLTQMQAVNTFYTTGLGGSFGISVFDEDNAYCNSYQDEDGSGTSNTQCISDDTVINLPEDDGTSGHVAAFTSFDTNGWTWNFSATLGTAVKFWYLAIEAEAAGNIKQLSGVAWASVKKVVGVAEASLKKVAGISAN